MGKDLERFIEGALCKGLGDHVIEFKGGKNWPPDFLVKNGAAIEVKKANSIADVQLNSSFPLRYFTPENILTNECRRILRESGNRDCVYAFGYVREEPRNGARINYIENLILVYGSTYVASVETYSCAASNIKDAICESNGESTDTRELGRVNDIDILARASLRIRGMWILKHPLRETHIKQVIIGLTNRIPTLVEIAPWKKYLEEEMFVKNIGVRIEQVNENIDIPVDTTQEGWKWKLADGNCLQIPAIHHANIYASSCEFACYKTILPDPNNPANDIAVGIIVSDF